MPCRRRGFTLVELLVVVGIIAVLVALLMPALGRVREHANRVKCAANLRSIGQAMAMYVQQTGYYPGCAIGGAGPAPLRAVWTVRIRAFMAAGSQTSDVFYCPSQDERCRWGDSAPGPAYYADDVDVSHGYAPGERLLLAWSNYFSYGYNGAGAGDRFKGLGHVVNRGPHSATELRATKVVRPAEMIAVADSIADGHHDFDLHGLPDHRYAWPGTVHSGGANVLFCDGHVQWYLQNDLLFDSTTPAGRIDMISRMWHYDHRSYGLIGLQ